MGELIEGAMQQAAQPLRQAGEVEGIGRLKHGAATLAALPMTPA